MNGGIHRIVYVGDVPTFDKVELTLLQCGGNLQPARYLRHDSTKGYGGSPEAIVVSDIGYDEASSLQRDMTTEQQVPPVVMLGEKTTGSGPIRMCTIADLRNTLIELLGRSS